MGHAATDRNSADPLDADEYRGAFEGTSILVTLESGKLVRVEYEAGKVMGERRFDDTAVVAGRWQEVEIATRWNDPPSDWDRPGRTLRFVGPVGKARVAFMVEGQHMKIRLDDGKPIAAECAWN